MAAYAAVISLKHTINRLQNSSRISLVSSTQKILEIAVNEATYLQQVLEKSKDDSRRSKSSHERLDALEGQIRDCAHKLEDVLEFYELSPDEEDEEAMRQEITSVGKAVKKMENDYFEELSRDDDDDTGDEATSSSRIDHSNVDVDMVGNSSLFTNTKKFLLQRMRPDELWFYAFSGEEGSGRTVVPNEIFEEARNGDMFDCCVWVNVGTGTRQDEWKQVVMQIIAQAGDNLLNLANDELPVSELGKYLYKALEDRSYMIVLKDVVDEELVNYLSRWLPYQNTGSVVIVITSIELVDNDYYYMIHKWPPGFFESRTWFRIRKVLFGLMPISAEMEVAGRKIIQNCRCNNVSVAKTLLFLLKSERTVDKWNEIATDEQNPIFMVADEISEISQIKIEMQNYDSKIIKLITRRIEFDNRVKLFKKTMHPQRFFSKMQIMSFYGMAGIGKTTFVRTLSKDEAIVSHFDHHVWINLGPKYQTEDILLDILVQIYPNIHKLHMKEDEKLVENLCVQLSCKRCLIVLDDLCSKEPLLHLKNLFPDIRGTTLVTTRLPKVGLFEENDQYLEIKLLDDEESWCLLRQMVFPGGLCLPELEKAGRKIAEKCDGLPLLIVAVADQLLKVDMSQEYWNDVASGKQKSVFKNAHQQVSEALLPCYQNLPQHLKSIFLYMGVFREKYDISTSKLTNLGIAEGCFEPNSSHIEEDFVAECLVKLVDRSLVMIERKVLSFQIKTCRLHAVFWHLSNSQAAKNKYFHAMNTYDDCSIENMGSQRRLCIRNSILLGMEYVQKSMASNTSAHSLLCVSPLHQYPVPLNFDFKLMRVMNAITIRLYKFPVEVVRLVHLRFLGLTCNGKLPTSISNLWKLQYLIVKRYMNISLCENSSSRLPVEIWDMKELKHLQIMGGCLPNHRCGTGLLKLSTLLDVSAQSCRKKVLKWIPNLKRLGIRIELVPGDEGNPFRCLNRISHLRRLELLKCVVVNPQIGSKVVSPPTPLSMFPPNLKELSLSGLGYPWEYMSIIGKLENLEVLKLKNYAFQGEKWEMNYNSPFRKLKFLLVEDTNLVHWNLTSLIPMKLEYLCISHCYKLKDLPIGLSVQRLKKIEIVDCTLSTMTWAKDLDRSFTWDGRRVQVHCSWSADIL